MGQLKLHWVFGMALIVAAAVVFLLAGWAPSAPADAPVQYQFSILHAFVSGSVDDGFVPSGQLVFDSKGNLYGTTHSGGTYGDGTVFELSPGAGGQWNETLLYDFCSLANCADGDYPNGLVMDAAGNFYGTTMYGGNISQCLPNGCGTVFEISPGSNGQWTESTIWTFCSLPNCADGGGPSSPPTLGPGGVLFGMGGDNAFELVPDSGGWAFNLLYTFCNLPNCPDGKSPSGPLVRDARGNLYGEAYYGGITGGGCQTGCGVVFALHPQSSGQWEEVVLYAFDTNGPDAAAGPKGGLAIHEDGLYGTTEGGGGEGCDVGCGAVFELTRGSGKTVDEQIIHAFGANEAGGIAPITGVMFNKRGDLFGVTGEGGNDGDGIVYGMKPQGNGKWAFAVLHSFIGSDGVDPDDTLTTDSQGNLYGTTFAGGPNGGGVVFELSPTTQTSK